MSNQINHAKMALASKPPQSAGAPLPLEEAQQAWPRYCDWSAEQLTTPRASALAQPRSLQQSSPALTQATSPQLQPQPTLVPQHLALAGALGLVAGGLVAGCALTWGALPAITVAGTLIALQCMFERSRRNEKESPSASWIGWTCKSLVMLVCARDLDIPSAINRVGGVVVCAFGAAFALAHETRQLRRHEDATTKHASSWDLAGTALKASLWPRSFAERSATVFMIVAAVAYATSKTLFSPSVRADEWALVFASLAHASASLPTLRSFLREASSSKPESEGRSLRESLWHGRDWLSYAGMTIAYGFCVSHWSLGVICQFTAMVAANVGLGALRIVALKKGAGKPPQKLTENPATRVRSGGPGVSSSSVR